MKRYKNIIVIVQIILMTISINVSVNSSEIDDGKIELNAKSAILVEKSTGKMLYGKNEKKQMYPASLTKILTAIVALEYIELEELIKVGYEINEIELDSSLAGHKVSESILGINLIRGLIMPSGNETANIVAQVVGERVEGEKIEFNKALKIFMGIINDKGKELGLRDSNFVTPHGYHDDNHYTTAEDMAIIASVAMDNDIIMQIANETTFEGNGAGKLNSEELVTVDYKWYTHNELITNNKYGYEYATGLKTGYTKKAGHSLLATAKKDDIELIAVILNSSENGRWEDAKTLFEYGFNNYKMHTLQTKGENIDMVKVTNTQLGNNNDLEIKLNNDKNVYIKKDEIDGIYYKITYNTEYLAIDEINEISTIKLKAPIEEGHEIGKIKYYTQGTQGGLIYEDLLISDETFEARSLEGDIEYYFNNMKKIVFSWIIAPISLLAVLAYSIRVRNIRKRRRNRRKYKLKTKY